MNDDTQARSKRRSRAIGRLVRHAALLPVHLYRALLSPLLPPSCLYQPSCSAFTVEAVLKHGILKGALLGLCRLFRCIGLFFEGGYDPVPEHFTRKALVDPWRQFRKKKR